MVSKSTLDKAVIAIIGLGYVGLPLAHAFLKTNRVIGFDIDQNKIREGIQNNHNQNFLLTSRPADIRQADFIIICVPTPVTKDKEVELSFIESAARIAGQNMKKGSTVVLESTVYPGVTEEIIKPILEKDSGMKCGTDFKLGYSPERINPGDDQHTVEKITKVVAGIDEETTELLSRLYGIITPSVYKARDIRTAEAAKVIENIQRDLNIALVNEFAIIFEKLGLNTRDVLDAAATKWNFQRYSPGLVGGYCIPVNPYYLVHKAREAGYEPQVILAGRAMNDSVPKRVADMMLDALNKTGKPIKSSTVLIMGLTYKANVSDIRESATKKLVKELKAAGVGVIGFDPLVSEDNFKNNWEDEFSLVLLEDTSNIKEKVAGVILTVGHSAFKKISLDNLKGVQEGTPILIDIPGSYDAPEVSKAGILYRTL